MTDYYLCDCSPMTSSKRMTTFHYEMFHGIAHVEGARPSANGRRCPGTVLKPVKLIRNVYAIPPVFIATGVLVVSNDVAKQIKPFRGVELRPVIFEEVFLLEYGIDRKVAPEVYQGNPDEWFNAWKKMGQPSVPPAEDYFECLTWTIWEDFGPNAPKITVTDPCTREDVVVSDGRLRFDRDDICKVEGGYFVKATMLEILKPFLREPYFRYVSIPHRRTGA